MKTRTITHMVKRTVIFLVLITLFTIGLPYNLAGQQEYRGVCAMVKIQILQEMTLERMGFLATLEITNNEGDADITNFSAALTFENTALSTDTETDDSSDLFFVKPPELEGITSIDGSGILPPATTAVIKWFIIPKIAAGGEEPIGTRYWVGVNLSGSIYGEFISPEMLAVIPDTIVVKPEPRLEITYFQPRDVMGDDPFTLDEVETPVPFPLGVLVKNVGYGTAQKLKVESKQPKIVDNQEGLLIVAQLLGARVNDEPLDQTSLTVNLGDIEPGQCRKGAWDMVTSISGEFVEFNASFSHSPDLGGEETSVISQMNAYFIAHEVLNDQPGRDSILDFLADTDEDENMIPETLYESDANILPVNHVTTVSAAGGGASATVTAQANFQGWIYMRMTDPNQAKYPVTQVVRSDGKILNKNNYWTNVRYTKIGNQRQAYLNIFDFVTIGDYEYEVTYNPVVTDTEAPVSYIRFSGEMQYSGGKYYILPTTRIYFTVDDESPVNTYYKLDGAPVFDPAYPFTITSGGEHTVYYYSEDDYANVETEKSATVVVATDYPEIVTFATDKTEMYYKGDTLSIVPAGIEIASRGTTATSGLDSEIHIYRGVLAWSMVQGVPSSPTTSTTAVLTVSGVHADYYIYSLDGNTWSTEEPVATPISLSGLDGTIDLFIKARSEYGEYMSDSDALHVTWVVSASAASTAITGVPAFPTEETAVSLTVTGADEYRYMVDGDYYRAAALVSETIDISGLDEGEHVISVIGLVTGFDWQDEEDATTVTFTINRNYSYDFSGMTKIKDFYYTDIASVDVLTEWDGKNGEGDILPSGWYTIGLTLTDALERMTSDTLVVFIADRMEDSDYIFADGYSQKNLAAGGNWVVWQDQDKGDWDIYTIHLADADDTPTAIADGLYHETNPQTDGRYAVWEDRQSDGTWDIRGIELGVGPSFAVTRTTTKNETNPVVYYPWIVYQTQAANNPNGVKQLMVYNIITDSAEPLDPGSGDQLTPSIFKDYVVWQDYRNPGDGDIYLKNIRTGDVIQLTDDIYGQYYPCVYEQWVIWSDKRDIQNDLYAYNILSGKEFQLTDTSYNETNPTINGKWVVYREDSFGALNVNIRMLHLDNFASLEMTNFNSLKNNPCTAMGNLLWEDLRTGTSMVMIGELPSLQPIYENNNAIAVTDGMVTNLGDAYTLLSLWNQQAGVLSITHYSSLLPVPVSETATWSGGMPTGDNFTLVTGSFLWVTFGSSNILDLGPAGSGTIDLVTGVNVFSYWDFPDSYYVFDMIREIGIGNINGVRVLNGKTGKWQTASVVGGNIIGENFIIPRVAVVGIDMAAPLSNWKPGDLP